MERIGYALVVDYDTIPLIGKNASKKMGLIKILDKVHAVTEADRAGPTQTEEKTSKARGHHIDLQDNVLNKYKDILTGASRCPSSDTS